MKKATTMAKMYPNVIETYVKPTKSEKKTFRFLYEAAQPHKDFICWYKPIMANGGKGPDFILFGKKLGLVIFEVKDWASRQIISSNPHQFTILISGKKEKKANPHREVKDHLNALENGLKEFPELLSNNPKYLGKLKMPISTIVVFSNITADEYASSRFKWFIDSERALFKNDLANTGEINEELLGKKFRQKLVKILPFPFKGLNQKGIERLMSTLLPETKINLPDRLGSGKIRFQKEVQTLDESQTKIALNLGAGHQIIKGPPGSGKTIILAHRCRYLYKYNPQMKKILFVCYNIALVGYLKKLLQDDLLGKGNNEIAVYHFFELCAQVKGEGVHFENEDSEYYDQVIQETLEVVLNRKSRVGSFDAILIDEGQDFDKEMLEILLNLLRPEGDFIVCLDSHQDLYKRRPSWKSLGIKASGRTRYLKKAYRNTVEIFESSQRFIGKRDEIETQGALLRYDTSLHGDLPELRQFRSQEEIEFFLIQDLKKCIDMEGYKLSEIAVIYDDKIYGPSKFAYDNRALPMRILNKLETSDIPAVWVSQDVKSKEMYDIAADRVSLISIHSSKGMDFDLVYLLGIDHIRQTDGMKGASISLVYVAMTRAKYKLVIPYIEESELITRIRASLMDNETCREDLNVSSVSGFSP